MAFRLAPVAVLASTLLLHPGESSGQEWFDDYARGVAALEAGKADRAIEFIERALRKRPTPGTNVVTYGTNRLREYYPLLKLAEAQLLAGDLDSARATLERSEELGVEPAEVRSRLEVRLKKEQQLAAARQAAAAVTTTAPPASSPPRSTPPAPSVPATGTLIVRSSPRAGASVLAGNRLLGTTPLEVELEAGAYEISILMEGFRPHQVALRVEAGRTNVVTHELVPDVPPQKPAAAATAVKPPPAAAPPPPPASLLVVSVPSGATAYLDDALVGSTDPETGRLRLSNVTPGQHRIRLSLPDYEELVAELEVDPTGETLYRGTLEARKTIPADAPVAAAAPPSLPSPRSRRIWWVPLIVALAGLVLALRWRSRNEEKSDEVTETASRWRMEEAQPTATKVSAETSRFGEYRLLRPLGRGGMAAVFLAERNGEQVALKKPSSELLAEPEFRERFLREASIGRTLHHPNIVRIFEQGEVDGIPYFTMELIDGSTLREKLDRGEVRGHREAAAIVLQIAEALDYAHLKGVVHRDLKPGNIMILKNGTCKVMDYGIARARRFEGITATGAFLGTPNYIAPETAEGKPVDARSDLYALGIIFYEMLTGRRPFDSDNPLVTLKRHCTEPPTPPSSITPAVPMRLEAMVLRLLAKSPEDRYPGAEELLIELRDYLSQDSRAAGAI